MGTIPKIIIPFQDKEKDKDMIADADTDKPSNDNVTGSLNDNTASCSHVFFSHEVDPEDFGHALDYLSLCMDPDDAKDYVDDLMEDAEDGKIEHYKVVDIFRAAKCDPATDAHAMETAKKMNSGQKATPVMLVRGQKSKVGSHPMIADGFHRLSAAYSIDPEMVVPCVVADK